MSCVIGLDPSLTGTGLIVLRADGELAAQALISTPAQDGNLNRYYRIVTQVMDQIAEHHPAKLCIEGLAMGAKGAAVLDLAGLHWVLRWELATQHPRLKVITVPPSSLKKWTTGKGTANKVAMALAVFKRWGLELGNDNLVDAYALAQYGRDEAVK